jgi:hypothetical protein
MRTELGLAVALALTACGHVAAPPPGAAGTIQLNQLGFLPGSAKWAVMPGQVSAEFSVIDTQTGAVALRGVLQPGALWEPSRDTVRLADFSTLTKPGAYRLQAAALPDSPRFSIAADAYVALNAASIKALYFDRAGIELRPEHASPVGAPSRACGHARADSRLGRRPGPARGYLDQQPQGLVRRRRLQQVHRQLGHHGLHAAGRLRTLPRVLPPPGAPHPRKRQRLAAPVPGFLVGGPNPGQQGPRTAPCPTRRTHPPSPTATTSAAAPATKWPSTGMRHWST